MALAVLDGDHKCLPAPTHRHLAPLPTPQSGDDHVADSTPEALEAVPSALMQARNLAGHRPDSASVLARLARCELDFGNIPRAVRAGEAALAREDPVDVPAVVTASQVLFECGRASQAEESLARLLRSAGDLPATARGSIATLYSRIAASRGDTKMALARLSDHAVNDSVSQAFHGSLLIQERRYEDAVRALRGSLRDGPPSADVLVNLGFAYGVLGSQRKAIRTTIAASSLAPSDRTAGLNLVGFLLASSQAAQALRVVDRLLAYHPGDLRLELAAADILNHAGKGKEAIRRLGEVKTQRRYFAASAIQRNELRLNIEVLEYQAGNRTAESVFATALDALEKTEYRSEIIARHLPYVSVSLRCLDRLQVALAQLRQVQDPSVLVGIEAQVSYLSGSFDETLEWYDRWINVDPFSTAAYVGKTYLLSVYRGEYEEAARVGRQALRLDPDDPRLRNNVAFSLAMAGQPAEAAKVVPDPSSYGFALGTCALIEMMSGDTNKGLAMYEASASSRSNDPELAQLIRLYRALAEIRVGLRSTPIETDLGTGIANSHDEPRFRVVLGAIERELAGG